MGSTSEFSGFESHDMRPLPWKPASAAACLPTDLTERAPGAFEIYAAAWGMAYRDHELDKLFNAGFYEI